MPTPEYDLIPSFGVEKYIPVDGTGGGAERTNDNLIVTLWEGGPKEPFPGDPLDLGPILVPRYASDGVSDAEKPYFTTAMRGRVGARFTLNTQRVQNGFPTFIVAVCNPPQEMKQQLAGSVEYNGGDPLDPASYTFKKSWQGLFAWSPELATNGGLYQNTLESDTQGVFFMGSPFPFDLWSGGAPFGWAPLLKTDGADGIAPEPFDASTAAGAREFIAALNRGEFFVPVWMLADDSDEGSVYSLHWPYSANRG